MAAWEYSAEQMSWRRLFPGRLDQLKAVRRLTMTLFEEIGSTDNVVFVAHELASNAIRHTRSGWKGGWFGLELAITDEAAHVAVTDLGGGRYPVVLPPQTGEDQAENGRGLTAIAGLAIAVGVHGSPIGGHKVWADLEITRNDQNKAEGLLIS